MRVALNDNLFIHIEFSSLIENANHLHFSYKNKIAAQKAALSSVIS
ncbi:hypothetical protein B4145_1456 [Bacillus subtilis]|nr:hypothetical protein B4068_1241 [Bacillus subtilis]KIN59668.1 hypothetical protein B4145_1456 [Bacillus subtilis]